ncbi:MAG TPA: 2-oxoglutarate and iron-dependent oxygenase domain-containing protein [Chryseolinea sp.]|nr:2-oxoglutarate and iron-dependent oxygenase domain-containing protein [Chryseolinea sp.]HPH46443.1 2-oxoglutarate and iron-dependent oxygenase domain-containing protein [Chryseolinea sp.]HPM30790.1 2-oxoglutarate and iron-dependent oxygenase domain-containing protein [Chryseolinea sp.]
MKTILYDEIPSLNLADFYKGDANQKQKFVDTLGAAYTNIGFAAIRNHFLTDDLQNRLYTAIKSYFALPDDVKKKYELTGLAGQRGHTGKGKEHAKGRNTGDLKEFYHVGQELSPTELKKEDYPENVWPTEVPDFKPVASEVYRALEKTGLYMLRAIALYLGLDEYYFDDKIKNGNSILRPIHYFPIESPDSVPADAVRAAEHGDINLITLLMGASADGLQVLRRDGKWIPITALPDQLVVNVGDMLERFTNKKLKSTIHRVVNPPRHLMNTPRYSVPFFMHPRSEMNLAALSSCVDSENPKQWDDITAGEFLDQRLREIGLKK